MRKKGTLKPIKFIMENIFFKLSSMQTEMRNQKKAYLNSLRRIIYFEI